MPSLSTLAQPSWHCQAHHLCVGVEPLAARLYRRTWLLFAARNVCARAMPLSSVACSAGVGGQTNCLVTWGCQTQPVNSRQRKGT